VSNTSDSNTQSPECIASNASALSTHCGSTSSSLTTLSGILALPKTNTPRTKRKRVSTLKQYASQIKGPLEQLKKKAKEKEEKREEMEKRKLDRKRRKLQKEKEKKVRKKPMPKKTGTEQKTGATKDGTENLTEQSNGVSVIVFFTCF